MAERVNSKISLDGQHREELKREIERIREDVAADIAALRARVDAHYLTEKAVVIAAGQAGTMVGNTLKFFRKFRSKKAS